MAKANARFATVKGQSETFGTAPFYVGVIQCERVASSSVRPSTRLAHVGREIVSWK